MKRSAWCLCVSVALSGCATATNGTNPDGSVGWQDLGYTPADPDAIVRTYLQSRLKDPYSMQLKRVGGPAAFVKKASLLGPGAHGWGVCYSLNAKNSYGGYTGAKPVFFVIRNKDVVDALGMISGNSIDAAMAEAACRQVNADL